MSVFCVYPELWYVWLYLKRTRRGSEGCLIPFNTCPDACSTKERYPACHGPQCFLSDVVSHTLLSTLVHWLLAVHSWSSGAVVVDVMLTSANFCLACQKMRPSLRLWLRQRSLLPSCSQNLSPKQKKNQSQRLDLLLKQSLNLRPRLSQCQWRSRLHHQVLNSLCANFEVSLFVLCLTIQILPKMLLHFKKQLFLLVLTVLPDLKKQSWCYFKYPTKLTNQKPKNQNLKN